MTSKDLINSGEEIVYAPMKGTAIPLCNIEDPVFSQEMVGKGVAILPSEGSVVAPIDGVITKVFKTKHAFTLESKSGLEVLIHIGLDTVKLDGKFFQAYVQTGSKVKVGDLLGEVDLESLKNAGYKCTTPVIISNTDMFREINMIKTGKVEKLDGLLRIIK